MPRNTDKRVWDLLLVEDREDHRGDKKTLYHNVCPLWELKDGSGMSGEIPFALERGDRLVIKERRSR